MTAPALVYLVRPGESNPELAHSLRSVEANLPHSDVWIVGYQPRWLTGVRHIPGNPTPNKPRNVFENIRLACTHPDMPDEFVIMNDDFYLMAPHPQPFTLEHRCLLAEHYAGQTNRSTSWAVSLRNTLAWLTEHGHTDPLSYELHKPIPVIRDQMAKALDECADYRRKYPPQWRTVYANRWGITGPQAADCKVYRATTGYEDWPLISTGDNTFRTSSVGDLIRARFPDPSPYEDWTEVT